MATTLEQLVEKVLYRLGMGHSESTKDIYRIDIESYVPEAIGRLYIRLNEMNNTSDLEVSSTVTLDSNGMGTLPDTLVLESICRGSSGYIKLLDNSLNGNLSVSFEPNFENRYLPRTDAALCYYSLKSASGINYIYVYKGDGQASPVANTDIEVLGIVIPTDPTGLSAVNISRLVDILVEICKEKLGQDQVPDAAPSNIPIKPVAVPTPQ